MFAEPSINASIRESTTVRSDPWLHRTSLCSAASIVGTRAPGSIVDRFSTIWELRMVTVAWDSSACALSDCQSNIDAFTAVWMSDEVDRFVANSSTSESFRTKSASFSDLMVAVAVVDVKAAPAS